MRHPRLWIEIVLFSTAIALGFALLFATLAVATGGAGEDTSSQSRRVKPLVVGRT